VAAAGERCGGGGGGGGELEVSENGTVSEAGDALGDDDRVSGGEGIAAGGLVVE
jgi:hypothetical protein